MMLAPPLLTRKRLALLQLFCFIGAQFAEGLMLAQRICAIQIPEACGGEESSNLKQRVPVFDPELEAAVRLFRTQWGLPEGTPVEVFCTCRCCGGSCTMGAACCCENPKIPFIPANVFSLAAPGCPTGTGDTPSLPRSLSWVFLLSDHLRNPGERIGDLTRLTEPVRLISSFYKQPPTPPP